MGFLFFTSIFFYTLFSFSWQYDFKPLTKYNGADLFEIAAELNNSSFADLDLARAGHFGGFSFDQIFVNRQNEKVFAVVIFDLIAPIKNKIFELGLEEVICHSTTATGRPFALYLSDRKFAREISYCQTRPGRGQQQSSWRKQLWQQFIPAAEAANCNSIPDLTKTALQGRAVIAEKRDWILQKMGTCLTQGLAGVTEVGVEISKWIHNPEKLWQDVSREAQALKNFVLNISSEVQSLIREFSLLDSELMIGAVCKLGTEVLVTGLLTGGAIGLVTKMSLAMTKLTLRLKNLNGLFTKLSELKKTGRIDLANGVLNCEI